MYKHLLVCTDGSEVAQKGVDHGLALAQSLKAKVTLITSTERFPLEMGGSVWAPSQSNFDDFDKAQEDFAAKMLAAAKGGADKFGVAADLLHIPNSRPAEAILQTAASRGCDLIVMASHGRRGLQKLLLGSQAQEVVTESPVPVLVVR